MLVVQFSYHIYGTDHKLITTGRFSIQSDALLEAKLVPSASFQELKSIDFPTLQRNTL